MTITQRTGTWWLVVWYMGTIASEYDAASFFRAESRTTGSSVDLVPIYPMASRWILLAINACETNSRRRRRDRTIGSGYDAKVAVVNWFQPRHMNFVAVGASGWWVDGTLATKPSGIVIRASTPSVKAICEWILCNKLHVRYASKILFEISEKSKNKTYFFMPFKHDKNKKI